VALQVGRRLGHFDVLAPLGAGGMGEVYRARDATLGRDVALKILPEALSRDAERRARIEREARALATLSHPGIAAIYGLEQHEGTPVLVMELVEGETLDRRLERGRVPVRQALDIGSQITEALGAAHEKGIIHRDLKPSNVKLTPEGKVKLLDFGLAKALAAVGADSTEAGTPSSSAGSTATGVVLGTAPYMSPEQVRGESLDRRTDIWSFGCVLYELLAGGRAFPGHTPESIAAVLEREPDWQALPPETPLEVQQLLRRCLQKDRARRLHDIADARVELEEALADLTAGREGARSGVGAARVSRRRRLALAGLVLGALAATHTGLFFWVRRTAQVPVPSFSRITFQRGAVDSARFSPDGQTVVYSARWQGGPSEVFSQRLGSADARPFRLAGARVIAVAGAEVAVILAGGTLARVPLEGGPPREVLARVADADWSADGRRFAVVRDLDYNQRLECPIGKVLHETGGIEGIANPRLSPTGDRIAFASRPWAAANPGDVVVVDLSGRQQVLSRGWEDVGGLAWSADGREVWFSATRTGMTRALHAVTLSGHERLVSRGTGSLILQDISGDHVLLADARRRAELRGRMAGDAAERDLSWLDGTNTAILSSDGNRLVFEEWGEGGGSGASTYLRRMDGSQAVRLGDGWPVDVSPDWKSALCRVGYRYPHAELRLIPIGPGEPRTLPRGSIHDYSWAFFHPDGSRIVIRANEEGRPSRLFIQRLPDGLPEPLGAEGVAVMGKHPVSPDGRFVVAHAPGRLGSWALFPMGGGDATLIAGLDAEDVVLGWSTDGRALFAAEKAGAFPMPIIRFDLRTQARQRWLELFPPNRDGVTSCYNATITPDGRFYAYSYERTLSDLYVVEGLGAPTAPVSTAQPYSR
jgi:Tol biopolymer transport system component